MVYTEEYISPIGKIIMESDGKSLTGLRIGEYPEDKAACAALPVFRKTKSWLDDYFAGKKPDASRLPLAVKGSPFRKEILGLLLKIPYGEVTTYGALAGEAAKRMGKALMAPQAVGGAVGANPIPIIIPCHRVVGAGNNLTGYGPGLDKKIWLLRHEGLDTDLFRMP